MRDPHTAPADFQFSLNPKSESKLINTCSAKLNATIFNCWSVPTFPDALFSTMSSSHWSETKLLGSWYQLPGQNNGESEPDSLHEDRIQQDTSKVEKKSEMINGNQNRSKAKHSPTDSILHTIEKLISFEVQPSMKPAREIQFPKIQNIQGVFFICIPPPHFSTKKKTA